MNGEYQASLDKAGTSCLVAGIVQIAWGVITLVGVIGILHIVSGILLLVARGKIIKGEGGVGLAIGGGIVGLFGFFLLVPLINIWPLIVVNSAGVKAALAKRGNIIDI